MNWILCFARKRENEVKSGETEQQSRSVSATIQRGGGDREREVAGLASLYSYGRSPDNFLN